MIDQVGAPRDTARFIQWYAQRPLVEAYHKCLKTGCRVEQRQYETGARLERVTGLLSIIAVRLLPLKSIARTEPDRPARQVVPPNWLEMLRALGKGRPARGRPALRAGERRRWASLHMRL